MATFSGNVAALARKIAADQIAQEIEANGKFATKDQVNSPVVLQEIIALYNGYKSESLDYRDYLTLPVTDISQAVLDFGNGYLGAT